MTSRRRWFECILAVMILPMVACDNLQESFDGSGVSVLAEADNAGDPNTKLGVPDVPDAGNATDNSDTFGGYTDDLGWDQHPNAKTGRNWGVVAGMSAKLDPCADMNRTQFVPPSGLVFEFLCHM